MIKKNLREEWKQMQFPGYKNLSKKYAASSHGRVASYFNDLLTDGKILNGSTTSGYKTLNLHLENGNGTVYIHREVAKLFSKRTSPKYKFVIHLNHEKSDNNSKNLKWATQEEVSAHQQKSPEKIAYKKLQSSRTVGLKLTSAKVKAIKDMIKNEKRKLTYKQVAEKYGVSIMTLYRIKSGENWGGLNKIFLYTAKLIYIFNVNHACLNLPH